MKLLFVTLTALCATASWGQNLTKGEEGRAAIGMCYSICFQRDNEAATELTKQVRRITDFIVSDNYAGSDYDAWNDAARAEYVLLCALMTRQYWVAKGCHYGCDDLEKAYGTTSSTARGKFHSRIRGLRGYLKERGLWNEESGTPDGEGLQATCEAQWDAAGNRGQEALSSILPKL